MANKKVFQNDYYVVSDDFKLLEFNSSVERAHKGIRLGEYCYKAIMNRDEPCASCPLAGRGEFDGMVYFDELHKEWKESVFADIGNGRYAVTSRLTYNPDGDENDNPTMRNLEIVSLNRNLQQRMNIIQTMSKIYFISLYVTMTDNTFLEISNQQFVREYIGVKGNAQEALYYIADHLVSDDTKEDVRDFVDFETLDERMRGKQFLTCEYFSKVAGWCQMYIIEGDRNEDGTLKTIVMAARTIHDEKRRELIAQNRLREAKNTAEAANAAKTSFLFNMSHDIRTPMNAIIGFRDLLEKHQDDPEKRQDYLKKIDDASNVLLSIINNVLEMARIEKGTLECNEVAWNVEQFTNSIFSVFHEMLEDKQIKYTHERNIQHKYLYIDTIKQREILLNLMSNAIKYTNPGGSIHVQSQELPYERDGWCIIKTSISDTGIGMSDEFLPHIFDEFAREHNNTESGIEGTGLGMAIVKRLVDFLGGTIEVHSKLGVGTTFTICMPHMIAKKSNIAGMKGDWDTDNAFVGRHILLAEDNELNAEIAIEILEEAGFVVEHAENGKVCVDMLDKSSPGYYDLVLMDVQMPVMNGYEATKQIRLMRDLDKANIPILAMTANAFEEDKKEAFRVGMNGHLAKPVDVKTLIEEIGGLLK